MSRGRDGRKRQTRATETDRLASVRPKRRLRVGERTMVEAKRTGRSTALSLLAPLFLVRSVLAEEEPREATSEGASEAPDLPAEPVFGASRAPSTAETAPGPKPNPSTKETRTVEDTQRPDPILLLERNDFPGSVPLFGSDFRFALGGYVKVDALVDANGNSNRYAFSLPQIPVQGETESTPSGYFSMHPFESRLNLDVRYFGPSAPTNQAFVEIDFFTTDPERLGMPRLRHAYMKWGVFLAGHTSALLTDLRPLPFIIDFAFADSVNAIRTTQVRYENKFLNFFVVRAGVEMPERGGVDNAYELPGAVSPRFPRAGMSVSFEGESAFLGFGASLSEIRWDSQGAGLNPSVASWAITANARAFLDEAKNAFIGAHGSIGQGSAETVGAFSGQNVNATLLADGTLEAIPTFHGVFGYAHRFLRVLSVNLAFAFDSLARKTRPDLDEMRSAWSIHGNVIVYLSKPFSTGLEYMIGERRNEDGATGQDQRVQTMAMYKF